MYAYADRKQAEKDKKTADAPRVPSQPRAAAPNVTGIPDATKTRFENLSGLSFDDVRVHYNSDKPAQLQALAYTQGNQVYVAPGQERHLDHELGHVVQQKQGRVRSTGSIEGIPVNTDKSLEAQADNLPFGSQSTISAPVPGVVQRMIGMEFQCKSNGDLINDATEEKCGHGVKLIEKETYSIQGDQGDFEFVTKAYGEGDISGLEKACENAANAHEKILDKLKPNQKKDADGKFYTFESGVTTYRFNPKISKKAHPQATVGIKKENLSTFLKNYSDIIADSDRPGKKPLLITPKKPNERLVSVPQYSQMWEEKKLYLPFGGSWKGKAATQKTELRAAADTDIANFGVEALGFLKLLRSVVRSTTSYGASPANAKTAMPIMPRTSLYAAFKLLPGDEQERIRTDLINVGAVFEYVAGSADRDTLLAKQDNASGVTEIKLIDWANSLPYKAPKVGGTPDELEEVVPEKILPRKVSGFSQLGDGGYSDLRTFGMTTDPTKLSDGTRGVLLELRGLEHDVSPSEWHRVGRDVAILARESNKGNTVPAAP